ncbi:MAG: hypothetical protein WCE50_07210 [Candidatus Acidiferrum sp.]
MKNGTGGCTQRWVAAARGSSARAASAFARGPRSTRSGSEANQSIGDTFSARAANKLPKTYKTSGWAAVYRLRDGSIRKKIIGHGMRPIFPGFGGGKQIRDAGGAFALFEKPAREQGRRVFLHPLIDQSADFLAEIGGMSETGQFKTLQGVPGSGEKKLPGGLRGTGGHGTSVKDTLRILNEQ